MAAYRRTLRSCLQLGLRVGGNLALTDYHPVNSRIWLCAVDDSSKIVVVVLLLLFRMVRFFYTYLANNSDFCTMYKVAQKSEPQSKSLNRIKTDSPIFLVNFRFKMSTLMLCFY